MSQAPGTRERARLIVEAVRAYKARSLKRAVSAVFGEAARATFEAALKVRD